MSFFFPSVICQKKSFLNHLQTHTLCVFPFFRHFLPCLSITVAVKTLNIPSLKYSVSLYPVHSLTLFPRSSFLSLPFLCMLNRYTQSFLVPVDYISMNSTFKCSLLHTKEQSHNSTKSPVPSTHAPASYEQGRIKSRCKLTHTNTFPE